MEKLFAVNNIGIQQFVLEDGRDVYFAYTDDLLKKNILIEFFEADEGEGESEVSISVVSYDEDRSYSFILSGSSDFLRPLVVYRIIADAIAFIGKCDSKTILTDLEDISTGFSTSDDFDHGDPNKKMYKSEMEKIRSVFELIKANIK